MSSCGPNDTSSCCRFSRAARWQDLSTANAAKDAAAKQAAVQAAKQAADEAKAVKAAASKAAYVAALASAQSQFAQLGCLEQPRKRRGVQHRAPCQWCGSRTCSHCRCTGYSGCSHAQGEPCQKATSNRPQFDSVCNSCSVYKYSRKRRRDP